MAVLLLESSLGGIIKSKVQVKPIFADSDMLPQ